MRAYNLFDHIVNLAKGFAFASICVLFSSMAHAAYYNLGAMIQGPKLVFTVQPSSSAYSATAFPVQPSVSIVKPNGSVVSSATDAVTLTAYTDSRCTTSAGGSLTATNNPKTAVSGVATFANLTYSTTGKIYLKATAPGKKPVCSQAVIVTQPVVAGPDPAQFKLTLIGPTSIGTNICTTYTVALRDQFDGVVTATSAMSVKYTTTGNGNFYSDSGCSTTTTSGSIAVNASQTTVYYKSSSIESNNLQVMDLASQVVDGNLFVNVTGYKLQLTGPQTADNGVTCAGPYNISYQLASGSSGGVASVDITGYQGAIYSNSGCSTVISGSGPVSTNGSGAASFYLLAPATIPGSPMIITVSTAGAASASLAVGITTNGAVASKLVISGTASPITSRCTAYTASTQDASSNYQPVAANYTLNITENNAGAIYSDNGCKTAATSFTLPAGSGQITFYFKDTTSETTTITAAASGLTSGTLSVTTLVSGGTPTVSAGTNHTCALLADQTVKCWGDNTYGQLGNGNYISSTKPVLVQGLNGVTAISAGGNFNCAIYGAGNVKCWGQGTSGQLGNGANLNSNIPVIASPLSSATSIAAGASHACAVNSTTVYCWGLGGNGQIGNGASSNQNIPTATSTVGGTPTAVGVGDNHSCVVLSTGAVKCWGLGTSGQIGNGANSSVTTPTAVSTISSGATAVTGGAGFTCALISGAVKCWGIGVSGQLGDGALTTTNTPVSVSGISTAVAVSSGTNHTCALLSSNTVKCWGVNSFGELGNGTTTASVGTPGDVSNLTIAAAISAGDAHSCAVLSDQTVQCWGRNPSGQLGNGNTSVVSTPTVAAAPTGVTSIYPGSSHICALLSDKTIKCWGYNGNGQLGNGTLTTSFTPVAVSVITNATSISMGASFGCAVLSTQGIKCWGYNGFGQLGNNSSTTSMVPVDVSGISTAVAVAAGSNHACALLSDRTVKCWGSGTNGQLGNNLGTQSLVPVSVSGINTAIAISSGGNHSCALLLDQTVQCWGLNASGQLGNNSTTNSLVPVAAIGVTSAIAIATGTGASHSCAIMSNQTVKCWGSNTTGQVGNNSTTNALTAVDVVGINTAYQVSIGGGHSCAVMSDKSMRCWGYNVNGQLGNGTVNLSLTPVNVLSNTPYAAFGVGAANSCGIQPDQRIKCNGNNDYGQTLVNTLTPGYVLEIPQ